MRNSLVILFAGLVLMTFEGCLVGHSISYEIVADKSGEGVARVTYTNIRSDATNAQQLEEDKNHLFNYMLKSGQFLSDMNKEGKEIVSRNLMVSDGMLNGQGVYRFDKISSIENLTRDDGFYFITLALDDSVLTTNGEIIKSGSYKRILWVDNTDTLKFRILTEPTDNAPLKEMAQYYAK
ncbi:MAG: hypothetical protein WCJ01_02050 [Ignavibacteria bacterium]